MAQSGKTDLSRTILLEGVPAMYALGVVISTTTTTNDTATICTADPTADSTARASAPPRMLFDTLQSIQYKIIRATTASGTAATAEIALANKAKIVYDVDEVSIDGLTEGLRASGATSGGTGLGQVIATITGGDIDSYNYSTFENLLDSTESTTFLLAFPNGFTPDSKAKGLPDGWVFMLGKRGSDYDKTQGNANTTQAITFDSVSIPSESISDATKGFKTKIKAVSAGSGIKAIGSYTNTNHTTGISLVPPFGTLTDSQIANIAAGKLVIVPTPTASYV